MPLACIKLKGSIISTTPVFIGAAAGADTLQFIPGSAVRGAFGLYTIKRFCIRKRPEKNHRNCEARNGCPYFELFRGDFKAANIIFRYAYPEHVGCKNKGVYIPFRSTCSMEENLFDKLFICSGCGHITNSPVKPEKINIRDLMPHQTAPVNNECVDFISSGTRFALEVIMPSKMQPYAEDVKNILSETFLKMGVGRWKILGFGRFVAKMEVQKVEVEHVEKRAEQICPTEFAVSFVSPAILNGNLLSPSVLLESARRAYTRVFHGGKPILPQIYLSNSEYSLEDFGGWSLKYGRPCRVEKATSAGSIFHFKSANSRKWELALALAALEYYALGKYKPHGCGQVLIVNK